MRLPCARDRVRCPGSSLFFFSFKKQLRNSLLRLYKYIIIYLIYCLANVYQCCMIFIEICFKINNLGKNTPFISKLNYYSLLVGQIKYQLRVSFAIDELIK